jgi:hypothetical protein
MRTKYSSAIQNQSTLLFRHAAADGGRAPAVDESIARLNIEHLRRELAREKDATRRDALLRRLTEEEKKLATLRGKREERK